MKRSTSDAALTRSGALAAKRHQRFGASLDAAMFEPWVGFPEYPMRLDRRVGNPVVAHLYLRVAQSGQSAG